MNIEDEITLGLKDRFPEFEVIFIEDIQSKIWRIDSSNTWNIPVSNSTNVLKM